jgi:metal-dependent amidase/aminoacylase/carboxypeptidase family protein
LSATLIDVPADVAAEVVATRRDLHEHPELGFEEVRTSGIVAQRLRALGFEVHTGIGKTGVVGVVRGARPGKTIMLRADMDALPIDEENEVPYRSQTAVHMHACGHDGHVAMLLGAARIVMSRRDEIAGTVWPAPGLFTPSSTWAPIPAWCSGRRVDRSSTASCTRSRPASCRV